MQIELRQNRSKANVQKKMIASKFKFNQVQSNIPFKKGINSFLVLSVPRALAIVFNRRTEFNRNCMSSFFNSSISIAIGVSESSEVSTTKVKKESYTRCLK